MRMERGTEGNQMLSTMFDCFLRNVDRDVIGIATDVMRTLKVKHKRPNITKAEQCVIMRIGELDVGYNISDKNYGAVIYSKDLFKEQCLIHLEDEKETYWKITDRSKEDILEDVLLELRRIILTFKRQGKGWEMTVDSINRDSTKAAKGGRLGK